MVEWWRIMVVYGPCQDARRVQFLEELLAYRGSSPRPWLLYGNFNMIYRALDKSNYILDWCCMRRFRTFLEKTRLQEIEMRDILFSWSNDRENLTLKHFG